jgi:hypothetical protein
VPNVPLSLAKQPLWVAGRESFTPVSTPFSLPVTLFGSTTPLVPHILIPLVYSVCRLEASGRLTLDYMLSQSELTGREASSNPGHIPNRRLFP